MELVRKNDAGSIKTALAYLQAPKRPEHAIIPLPELKGMDAEGQLDRVVDYLAEGRISLEFAHGLINVIESRIRHRESFQFARFLARINNGEDPIGVATEMARSLRFEKENGVASHPVQH
jgi:hypothetical protein